MGDSSGPALEPEQIFRVLANHRVNYVVIGGLAATIHGSNRITYDIDVVPDPIKKNIERLAAALVAMRARLRVPSSTDPITFPIDAESLQRFEVSTWRTDYGDLDVISGTPTAVRGVLRTFKELASRAESRQAFGLTIAVAALSDIIEAKQALSREPDLAALPELHRLQKRLHGDSD